MRYWIYLPMLCLSTAAMSQPTISHGPIVGAVTSNSAKIVLRTTAETSVAYEVSTDASFAKPVLSEEPTTQAADDYFATIEINGLQAETKYYYRARIGGVVDHTSAGSFETFPPSGLVTDFMFTFGACQQIVGDPMSYDGKVFDLITELEPRFFLQIGDWTYPDTTDGGDNPLDYFNVDFQRVQANYRSKYDSSYAMANLFRVSPIDYVYDDHDYSNDNSDGTFPGRENSILGYTSMFPHYPLANSEGGIWHKFTFGHVDFFVLDTRAQRDANLESFEEDASGRYSFNFLPNHNILQRDSDTPGELQMDWLIRELKASEAHWKFIASSVPFNPGFRVVLELALELQGSAVDPLFTPFGPVEVAEFAKITGDSWNGFPASVARLTEAVHEADVQNVIILSGDTHTAAIDDGANSLFPEIMAGGLDRTNSQAVAIVQLLGIEIWNQGGQTLASNNFNNHFGKVTVFGKDSVMLELVDDLGELLASYVVPSGHLVSKVGLSHALSQIGLNGVGVGSSASATLILANTGADTVFIADISIDQPVFTISPTSLTLAPGRRSDVLVEFLPTAPGRVDAILAIESNAPGGPRTVKLTARATQTTAVKEAPSPEFAAFSLSQNYPNPFNGLTRIDYTLAEAADVSITVFNLSGQQVRNFGFPQQSSGHHFVRWDGSNALGRRVASGIYVYRIVANIIAGDQRMIESRKMVFLQ